VAEIRHGHQISPSQYYGWRDQFLAHAANTFEAHQHTRLEARWRVIEQVPVNKKRMLRLLREHHLLVPPNSKLKAKRVPIRSKPRPTKLHEWWGIDMPKVLVEGFGWVDSVLVLAW
jgi:transposase-like protein